MERLKAERKGKYVQLRKGFINWKKRRLLRKLRRWGGKLHGKEYSSSLVEGGPGGGIRATVEGLRSVEGGV